MSADFLASIAKRRSQYAIGKDVSLSKDQIDTLVKETVRLCPSAFNSQSSRAIILHGEHHVAFWDIVKEEFRKIAPAEAFAVTEKKINGFAAGAGTILYYEDQDVVKGLQDRFPSYADNFPIWSEHSTAMAQFAVWTALAAVGIGASLQHYNPLPDSRMAAKYDIPLSWKLRAQMPFGSNEALIGDKSFADDSSRFLVFH